MSPARLCARRARRADFPRRRITYEKRKQTFSSVDPDHYQVRIAVSIGASLAQLTLLDDAQKVTAFSRSTPPLLAAGSTDSQLSLVTYPDLENVLPTLQYEKEEIYDADFNDAGDMVRQRAETPSRPLQRSCELTLLRRQPQLAGTSSNKLCVWSTKVADKEATPEPLQVIERPVLKKELACTFRAAKSVSYLPPLSSLPSVLTTASSQVRSRADCLEPLHRRERLSRDARPQASRGITKGFRELVGREGMEVAQDENGQPETGYGV